MMTEMLDDYLKPNDIAEADRSHPTPTRFCMVHLSYPMLYIFSTVPLSSPVA